MSAMPDSNLPESPSQQQEKSLVVSLNKVRTMIKQEPDFKSVSTEACFAVAKATELFLESLAQRGAEKMLTEQRSSLDYKDVAEVVAQQPGCDFLDEIVPQKVPAAVVLARMTKPVIEPKQEQAQPAH